MGRGRKEVIKVKYTVQDQANKVKRLARELIGTVPGTRVEPAKKGGTYTRKTKHPARNDED